MNKIDLTTSIGGITFKNPVIAASGTFGFGLEYEGYMDLSELGGISVKGLTLKPKEGNPPPRIAETPSGILNSVGLQNPGLDFFLEDLLPRLRKYDTVIIANINGNTFDEYVELAGRLNSSSVDMIEVNLSCPNVKEGGIAFGTDPQKIREITRLIKKQSQKPIIVKLTPNVTDISEASVAVEEGGGDAVSLVNTFLGMAIDAKRRRPLLANITGGLSGPAIKPIALRMVWEASRAVNIPIVGMGGIMTGEDVAEFLLAGARAVSVGTANIKSPIAMIDILKDLEGFMEDNKINRLEELIGGLILED